MISLRCRSIGCRKAVWSKGWPGAECPPSWRRSFHHPPSSRPPWMRPARRDATEANDRQIINNTNNIDSNQDYEFNSTETWWNSRVKYHGKKRVNTHINSRKWIEKRNVYGKLIIECTLRIDYHIILDIYKIVYYFYSIRIRLAYEFVLRCISQWINWKNYYIDVLRIQWNRFEN